MSHPQITFGIIVLNGQPFVRYNLRALYPFAHQIIVVEGAAPAATGISDANGHSSDGTLDILRNFQAEEDPENKLIIVTAEDEGYPNGFWPGEKHEQSQAYAKRATGNYLWQVDIDEFYMPEDMQTIVGMLGESQEITAVSFPQLTFWGGLKTIVDGWYLRRGWCAQGIHRLFKWGPDYNYVTHRPPTVHDPKGRDLRNLRWVNSHQLVRKDIYLYHYSLLFPKQVMEKCTYYRKAEWAKREQAIRWAKETFLSLRHPFRVHNVYEYPSWLERYSGTHPPQILNMYEDIQQGRLLVELRQSDDVENLLASPWYAIGTTSLKGLDYVDRLWRFIIKCVKITFRILRKIWRLMKQKTRSR